jgi:hypothetical protein
LSETEQRDSCPPQYQRNWLVLSPTVILAGSNGCSIGGQFLMLQYRVDRQNDFDYLFDWYVGVSLNSGT